VTTTAARIARWLGNIRHGPILALLAVWLILALRIGNDFGLTYDERRNTANGAAALRAYAGSRAYFRLPALSEHGPLYFELMSITGPGVERLLPGWSASDGRHLTHFLAFLSAVYCFYLLSLRVAGRTPAWMASVLFATQPLLVGHGFINQKDTPFMALFLAAVITGLAAVDRLTGFKERTGEGARHASPSGHLEPHKRQWGAMKPAARWFALCLVVTASLIVVDVVWLGGIRQTGEAIVKSAYEGRAIVPIQRLFDTFATDAHKTPLSHYLSLFDSVFDRVLRWPLAAAATLVPLIALGIAFPRFGDRWGLRRSVLRNGALWASAALLAAAICVRQLGLFAGGLVALAMLRRHGTRAIFPLVLYGTTAACLLYLSWPYLWPAPVSRLIDSLVGAVNFPGHDVFFQGQWLSSNNLPWYYLPKLVGLQLTIPAIVLAVAGMAIAVVRLRSGRSPGFLFLLLVLWIAVPAVALIFLGMSVYGNIRHLLFTMPPILVFSAVAFDALRKAIRPGWLVWPAFVAALIPGVWGIVSLHPYEYTYMNEFIGGVSGAYGRYELDRQCTSLREGIEAVDDLAGPDSIVAVPRQVADVRRFARADLHLVGGESSVRAADFALTCSWPNETDLTSRGYRRVYTVRRGRAVLASVWQR
jgi:hypothetical protein